MNPNKNRYFGIAHKGERKVYVVNLRGEEKLLPTYLHIANHSPDGFSWGHLGSGPSQLALALIAETCGQDLAIPQIYQRFKEEYVSRWDQDSNWEIHGEDIDDFVFEILKSEPFPFPPTALQRLREREDFTLKEIDRQELAGFLYFLKATQFFNDETLDRFLLVLGEEKENIDVSPEVIRRDVVFGMECFLASSSKVSKKKKN